MEVAGICPSASTAPTARSRTSLISGAGPRLPRTPVMPGLGAGSVWAFCGELAASGLVALADKGYAGLATTSGPRTRDGISPPRRRTPNRAHARLRAPGESWFGLATLDRPPGRRIARRGRR